MTVEQWARQQLGQYGMFESQIDAVLQRVKADKSVNAIHWSSPKDEYPSVLFSLLMMTIAGHALEWIDENMPLAWYRPIFAEITGEQANA